MRSMEISSPGPSERWDAFWLPLTAARRPPTSVQAMKCTACDAEVRKPKRREFPRLKFRYLVCDRCGKGQRLGTVLRTSGRGTRPTEREQLRATLAIAVARVRLKTLVWGPNPNSDDLAAEKRKQIRADILRDEGQKAFFSEDLQLGDMPNNVLEMIQQHIVDLVICVGASWGSAAEFESFGVTLGPKLLAWFPSAARGGFADGGSRRVFHATGGFDETYNPEDLISCVVTLASIDWFAEKKFLQVYVDQVRSALDVVAPAR